MISDQQRRKVAARLMVAQALADLLDGGDAL